MVPEVVVDHAPIAEFATEAYAGPSESISLPIAKQLGTTSGRGLETQSPVSEHAVLMILSLLITGCLAHFGFP
jgi:hypothetical protein